MGSNLRVVSHNSNCLENSSESCEGADRMIACELTERLLHKRRPI